MNYYKKLILIVTCAFTLQINAKENIHIYSPYNAAHSGHAVLDKVLKKANAIQDEYNFLLISKPGGQGLISLKEIEKNSKHLSIINAAFVELIEKNKVKQNNFIPVYSIGEACWAVTSLYGDEIEGIESIKNIPEIIVGTVGNGNSTHLTALEIGKKYNIPVRLILFKSNQEALINMVGNNGINFTIERLSIIENFKEKNSNIKILAITCNKRFEKKSYIKTLVEQNINVPPIFNLIVAHYTLYKNIITKIKDILENSTKKIGLDELIYISDMKSAVFDNVDIDFFYNTRINELLNLRRIHKKSLSIE